MKKIFLTLTIAGLVYSGADAQTTPINVCGTKQDKVCRVSNNRKSTSCYKTGYAENFKVCKGNAGYFVCCETPDFHNSTYAGLFITEQPAPAENRFLRTDNADNQANPVCPRNQSYINIQTAHQ